MSLAEPAPNHEPPRRQKRRVRVRSEILLWAREVVKEFWRVDAERSASALAFTTLISLVPALVLLLMLVRGSIGSVFPQVQVQIEEILHLVLPYEAPTVTSHIKEFVANAQTVSVMGIVVLVFVSFRLFSELQVAVNQIWRVERPKSFRYSARAFVIFAIGWPVVAGLAITTNVALRRSPAIRALIDPDVFPGIYAVSAMLLAFTFVFWFLPATRVRFWSAFVGAILTTSLFELTRLGMGWFFESVFVGRINLIYGALALLIIFLVVVQLIWVEVLLGVVGSFVHQHLDGIVRAAERRIEDRPEYAAYYAFRAVLEIASAHANDSRGIQFDQLAGRVESTDSQLLEILDALVEAGLIVEPREGTGWVLDREPDRITLDHILDAVHPDVLEVPSSPSSDSVAVAVSRFLGEVRGSLSTSVGKRSVADLLRAAGRDDTEAKTAPSQVAPNASPPVTSESQ